MDLETDQIAKVNTYLSVKECDDLVSLFYNSRNTFFDNGIRRSRFRKSTIGQVLIAFYDWKEIAHLIGNLPIGIDDYRQIYTCRILEYNQGDYIGMHCDASSYKNASSISILLNDEFKGGRFSLENKNIHLEKGQGIDVPMGVKHEVSMIKQGTRFSLNIRYYK